MKFRIRYDELAVSDLGRLPRHLQAAALNAIESILSHQATETSKSRIKRLRNLERPQYRLRIDDLRVFYSVASDEVTILGITTKEQSLDWLEEHGSPPNHEEP